MNKVIRFGIIGCGTAGKRHAQALASVHGAQLAAVASKNRESALKMAADYPNATVLSIDKLTSSPEIDAICICSPNKFHATQTLEAINHGKAVVVEKPIAMSKEEARQIVIAAQKKKTVPVVCVFPRRFDKTWQALFKLIASNKLGKINRIAVEQFYYRKDEYYLRSSWHGRKDLDGGILLTQAIHYIDIICKLMSHDLSETLNVSSLTSIGIKTRDFIDYPDNVSCHFTLSNGVLYSVSASTSIYPGFSAKVLIASDIGSVEVIGDKITRWGFATVAKPIDGTIGWSENSVEPIIQDLVGAIRNGKEPTNNLQTTIKSLGLTLDLNNALEK